MASTTTEKKNITIIGGGIIGCSTAYYLTRHPSYSPTTHNITLLEASSIAGGASGKAGGLLALWAYPENLVPLSYKLHAELAKEHNGAERWGYRRVHCGQLDAKGRPAPAVRTNGNSHATNDEEKSGISFQKRSQAALSTLRAAGVPADLDWVSADAVRSYDEMGNPNTTAQVHPRLFTTAMAELARDAGVTIITDARVTSLNPSPSSSTSPSSSPPTISSVTYTHDNTTHDLPTTTAVLAAGPWTARLLPSAPISGLRSHSVTIRPSRPVSAYALFTSISVASTSTTRASHAAPEIYARPDAEVYACGDGDTLVPLPETTADVAVDLERCNTIVEQVGSVSDELRDGKVTARQACYLPVCRGGDEDGQGNGPGPWIGQVKEWAEGAVVVAAGHSCWGIQNGPGTGMVVSEIVMGGRAVSAVLGRLDARKMK